MSYALSAGLMLGFMICLNILTLLIDRLVDLLKDKNPLAAKILHVIGSVTTAFGGGLASRLGMR